MRRLWYHRQPGVERAQKKPRTGIRALLNIIGPGFITGAADDDPSGIATYSQTGAQFGFGQLWTALYQVPLLLAVQECCGRIGAVTGKGLAGVIKEHYSRKILLAIVLLVLVANIINIGADIGAVAASARLVYPAPFWLYAIGTAAVVTSLEIWLTYPAYANILKWLALALLSYVATALMVANDWHAILRATFVPHIEFNFAFLFIITGVLGTSISPYMFFWQASEEVEEERAIAERDGKTEPELPPHFIFNMRIDTTVGMVASQLVQWFIIITTGTVLFAHGVKNINTAADAAAALEPLVRSFPNAGQLARDIFAFGVVGLGLLAIPVLAGSAAYALAEALDWKLGLSKKFGEARGFYVIIMVATVIGLALNFIGIDPMKALVYTAVFNGIAAVPLIFVIARLNGRADVLGEYRGGPVSRFFVWLAFVVMAIAGAALVYTTLHGGS
ncbi:NRAMP (natural resistance-associated macrophage protein)-like metal ion transporter [Methylovirgula ligni]|uniref:NRAMP (Natural resistance-associated macrophage protein)-like metal ion transporter n=1 Tax=Methylovirgula ligni TaxID=569860 RepID=A0A3D9YR64_9HYPH|nr:divalent metal cation transporter [Methylovirgula ligni]REF84538.1 NRAMP (natural resistance-associated macrophage protein)-like metal ion transporter [Methylovirgula ligni]